MALILRNAAAATAHRLLAAGMRQVCVPALSRGMSSTSPGNRNVALLEMEPGLPPDTWPVTKQFMAGLGMASKYTEEQLRAAFLKAVNDKSSPSPTCPELSSEDQEACLGLLSETLNIFFSMADEGVPVTRNMRDEELSTLRGLRAALNERLHGPPDAVVNTAPPGQLPWEVVGVDEARGRIDWAADLTAGRSGCTPWRAGALAHRVKRHMAELHAADPVANSPDALAAQYGVRVQRVLAILATQEREAEVLASMPEDQAKAVIQALDKEDAARGATYSGGGERHHVVLPSVPNYQEPDMDAFVSRLEAAVGKPADQITDEDLTPEVAARALGVQTHEEAERRAAAEQEAMLIAEFRDRLDYNMGRTGKSLQRASRRTRFVRRPANGWPLLVKELGDGKQPGPPPAYVAGRDGSRRELNEDEALLLRRQTPLRRRRIT